MIKQINLRIFSGMLFFFFSSTVNTQEMRLAETDSLFDQEKYTQALDKYDQLYMSGLASHAMLLKMAFINEALENYAKALFYLDQYYQKSVNRKVISKIEKLANTYGLSGYQYTDADYFVLMLRKYRLFLMIFMGVLAVLMAGYLYRKVKAGEKPLSAIIAQFTIIILLAVASNFSVGQQGILSRRALLRSGPSAGASPVELIPSGHKVEILQSGPIWTKISWQDKSVYLRSDRLMVI